MNSNNTNKGYWRDQDWGLEHYGELVVEFAEMWVAIVEESVVAHGDSPNAVRKLAREKTGKEHVPVLFVEGGVHVY
jgi:lactam utilization protein B